MTILDEMEAALRFYESAWVNNSYGSADGDPGKRLLADKGQRARETLREYESLKGQIAVVPVQTSEAREAALEWHRNSVGDPGLLSEGEKGHYETIEAALQQPDHIPDVTKMVSENDERGAPQQPDTSEAVRVLVEAIKEAAKGCSAISLIAPEIKDCREYAEMMKVELDRILSNPAVIAAMKGEDQ